MSAQKFVYLGFGSRNACWPLGSVPIRLPVRLRRDVCLMRTSSISKGDLNLVAVLVAMPGSYWLNPDTFDVVSMLSIMPGYGSISVSDSHRRLRVGLILALVCIDVLYHVSLRTLLAGNVVVLAIGRLINMGRLGMCCFYMFGTFACSAVSW